MVRFFFRLSIVACFLILPARATEDVVSAAHGTITKVDSAAKTITVKTKDGTEHTVHFVDRTAVHGAEATATGSKDTFHGLTEGTEVVAHYTEKGGEKTAVEIDRVGKDGVKTMDGTVSKVGKDGKTVVVKGADGTEHSFDVAGKDTAETAKEIGKGADKSAKVTVYYTEKAGKKVAHFFEKL
jgi:endonuclease YncB( thermonuclease family)